MPQRRFPRWSEFAPLLRRPRVEGNRRQRRMARAASIWDLRERARSRTPRAVFDYVDGAAEDEISLGRSRDMFRSLEFQPNVLRDVSAVDTSVSILGERSTYPFGFAPTGYTRMMHHEGESAVARVAEEIGIPYALSTVGTTTPEDVAAVAPLADKWFQLYVWRDREVSYSLMERAAASGFRALVLTVDLPVGGARLRDVRNGLTVPPAITARTIINGARHPNWWFNFLTTEPLEFATLTSLDGTVADSADRLFDPALNTEDLVWLRDQWDGPIVVKGIQTVQDARMVVDLGVDAVVISNHGGRQLDRSPTPLRLIGTVSEAVGDDAEVFVDGGIMNGADIVAAVALGAQAAFVGRAYLFGLMAGGIDGVRRSVQLLGVDIVRTMKLLGVTSVADLHPGHVKLP